MFALVPVGAGRAETNVVPPWVFQWFHFAFRLGCSHDTEQGKRCVEPGKNQGTTKHPKGNGVHYKALRFGVMLLIAKDVYSKGNGVQR